MPTQAKIDQVSDLREKLEKCSIAVTTTYTNISVNEMTELRRQTRAAGLDFLVVKNTLMSRAADAAQLPQIKEIMQGPTAIAFGYDEPVDVARILHDYIRATRSALTIQGAVMGGGPALNTGEVERLSSLPTKPQLIAQLLGQMQAPIYGLLRVLNGPVAKFGYLLQARIRQLEAEGPAAVVSSAPAAEETAAAEAEPVVAEEAIEAAEAEPAIAQVEAAPVAEAEPAIAQVEAAPVAEAEPAIAQEEATPVAEAEPAIAQEEAAPVAEAEPAIAQEEAAPVAEAEPAIAQEEAAPVAEVEPAIAQEEAAPVAEAEPVDTGGSAGASEEKPGDQE